MKRLLDLIVSVILLLILSPLLVVVSIVNIVTLGRPVLFRQARPGYQGQIFSLYKFRSMRKGIDQDGEPLPNRLRLTPFGRFIRKTSIDELPSLLNVLKGEMSLVGPRPLKVDYLPLYNDFQARRHDVKPGITGWAQVKGRNQLSWDERFSLDVWYVENRSFWLDLKILVMTAAKVLRQKDVGYQGNEVESRFTGNKQ